MQLPVDSFEVDNPAQRAAAGPAFSTMPSDKDIVGTRQNMLGEQVLNGLQHPYLRLVSVDIAETANSFNALTRITVRGVSTDINISFKARHKGRRITIKGETEISQTELGLQPFSILMGAIAVQDEMTIQFDLTATRVD